MNNMSNLAMAARHQNARATSIGPAKDGGVKLFMFGRNAPAIRPKARHHPVRARLVDGRRSRPSTCRCPGGRILRPWITSRAAATIAGRSTWKAMAAPPRTATTTRRSRKAPTTAMPPRSISRNCAASGRCWCTAFPRARCARRCSPSGIRRWWRGSRSTPWCGPAKARRRSSNGARSCRNSWPRTGGRSTRRSSIRSSTATIPAPPRKG